MQYTNSDITRFISKIQYPKDIINECWIFNSSTVNNYPRFWLNSKWINAHRFMYQYHFKVDLKQENLVCHSCDTPFCVNPNHLFIGTYEINNKDRDNKNRQAKGEDFSFSKLTDDIVREIIIDVYNDKYQSIDQICLIYNVKRNTIVDIFNGLHWKHITNQLVVPLNQIRSKIIKSNQDGENNNLSKLKANDVLIIRQRLSNNESISKIAKDYNVNVKTISNIKNNKSWQNI